MANIKQILKGIIGSISRLNRLAQTRFDFVGNMIYFKYVELVSTSSALPLFVQVSIFYILPYLGYLFGI